MDFIARAPTNVLETAVELASQSGEVQVGLAWDFVEGQKIDLDASAVCFSFMGVLRDAAYYNQLSACDGAILHSGDNRDGRIDGYDEFISVNLDAIKNHVSAIVFLVSAYSGGSLDSMESTCCEIKQNGQLLASVATSNGQERSTKMSMMICMLFRHPESQRWNLVKLLQPVPSRHFAGCMLQMRSVVDQVLDPGLLGERCLSHDKTFKMEKGDQLSVPTVMHKLTIGLGWTTTGTNLDLDASCLLLQDIDNDGDLDPLRAVYYGRKEEPGVKSTGDNLTGEGDGDDEQILIDLDAVDPQITALAVIVTIFTRDKTFAEVPEAYVRLFDQASKHEYARYVMSDGSQPATATIAEGAAATAEGAATTANARDNNALIFCMLVREANSAGGWTLLSVGEPCQGRTVFEVKTALWDGTCPR